MAGRPFEEVSRGEPSLLEQVEAIVLDGHRRLWEMQGKAWSKPAAYHWLHYEDAHPIQRLAEGVEKLSGAGATFDAHAVDKVCADAVEGGFSN